MISVNKIIVITGPTGVGKTSMSIELAKEYDAEIINADSVQIYKDLNIGSAKVTKEEMCNIPHHLLDYKEINENYSIFEYQKDVRNKICEIKNRGKNVIIVGGTGLYIKSALYNYEFKTENKDNYNNYDNLNNDELYELFLSKNINVDVHKNNRKRIIRLLNKDNNSDSLKGNELLYDAIFIGLTTDRKNLYNIINKRVDKMIENGLVDEVEKLYTKNSESKILNTAIGYKEIISYLKKEISLNDAIELIKKNSRRYAKRQYTWFNNQMNIKWFDVNYNDFKDTINNVKNYIKNIEKRKSA